LPAQPEAHPRDDRFFVPAPEAPPRSREPRGVRTAQDTEAMISESRLQRHHARAEEDFPSRGTSPDRYPSRRESPRRESPRRDPARDSPRRADSPPRSGYRGRYREAFLRAVAARGEIAVVGVALSSVPRITPGERIDPFFTLTWLMPQRRRSLSLRTVRSPVGREEGKEVAWREGDFPEAVFPVNQSPDQYSLKIQVFSGTPGPASDFVAASAIPLVFLADHAEPHPSRRGQWSATLTVQHADHIKLAKRHRVPTLATLQLLV